MLKSDAVNSTGLCWCTLLWDMTKFYEGISLERSELHRQRMQFPPVLYRLSIAASAELGLRAWATTCRGPSTR
eukprot:6405597-Pyramimonas_sp.AAC.1